MTIKIDRVKEYEALLDIYEHEKLDKSLFGDRIAAIIISGDRIIGLNRVTILAFHSFLCAHSPALSSPSSCGQPQEPAQ